MITAKGLSFGFGARELYKNISFELDAGKHCALIGGNGTGKTTLTDLICDPERYIYSGKLLLDGVGRIGRVDQFATRDENQDLTVLEMLRFDFEQLDEKIAQLCAEMEDADDLETLLEQYQQLLDESEAMDSDNREGNIHRQLHLAELEDKAALPLRLLSGGEYKLVQIIRQMLRRPGLLIMDEPDVFLDFENLTGLRDLINGYPGTMLVITHNRYILNHCFDRIWHLENGDLQEFDGNYTEYKLALLQTKIEAQETRQKEEAEIGRLEAMVERLRDAAEEVIDPAKGRTLRGKVAFMERLKARRVKAPFVEIRQPEIRLPVVETEEKKPLLQVSDLSISFDKPLLTDVNFSLEDGQKLAIVGANGSGKTSLLRLLHRGNSSHVRYCDHAKIGWFSQLQETIPQTGTIYQMFDLPNLETPEKIEIYLSKYGFEPDSLNRQVAKLSGGERNLLQLAKLCAGDSNLLLLDEPSSHLDTYAQIALEQALRAYQGAVVMVSHDFYTISNCVDTILYAENGTLRPMSPRAFRKMIYKHHFRQDYLEFETRKQALEVEIDKALQRNDTPKARQLWEELVALVEKLS